MSRTDGRGGRTARQVASPPPDGPAARRPDGPTARRPDGPTARRPDGPTARRPDGPTARRPGGPVAGEPARQPENPAARQPRRWRARLLIVGPPQGRARCGAPLPRRSRRGSTATARAAMSRTAVMTRYREERGRSARRVAHRRSGGLRPAAPAEGLTGPVKGGGRMCPTVPTALRLIEAGIALRSGERPGSPAGTVPARTCSSPGEPSLRGWRRAGPPWTTRSSSRAGGGA